MGTSGQVIPKKVKVLPDRLNIIFRRQRIEEAEAEEWINSLPANVYVTGTLQVEDAGELALPIPAPGTKIAVTKTADGVALDHATPNQLRAIEEFFILSGEVVIKRL